MQETQVTKLTADNGKMLTNGIDFVDSIILDGGSASDWEEITTQQVELIFKTMTPREFILKLLDKGITRSQIEALINTNDRVWAELNYATVISRANPLLDQLCGQFNLTPADVDEMFL